METIGTIYGITLDYNTGKPVIQILCEDRREFDKLDNLRGNRLRVVLDKYKAKRSISSNNYFHALCGQIAQAMSPPISANRCKNLLIGRYGQPDYLDAEKLIPAGIKSNISPEYMLEQPHLHVRVAPGGDEKTWFYRVMRDTHTYNTAEFSKLLDGTIAEAQELGIDTITDTEKQKMLERWANEKRFN